MQFKYQLKQYEKEYDKIKHAITMIRKHLRDKSIIMYWDDVRFCRKVNTSKHILHRFLEFGGAERKNTHIYITPKHLDRISLVYRRLTAGTAVYNLIDHINDKYQFVDYDEYLILREYLENIPDHHNEILWEMFTEYVDLKSINDDGSVYIAKAQLEKLQSNAVEYIKKYQIPQSYIQKSYLEEHKLKPKHKVKKYKSQVGRPRVKINTKKLIKLKENNYSTRSMAKKLNTSHTTIIRILKRLEKQ